MSHDINTDPEVIELTDKFDLFGLKVWLQMLSVADRNNGMIKGRIEWIARSLTWLWASNSRRYNTEWRANQVRMMLEWMANKHWISIELDSISVCKFAEYHKTRGTNKRPSEPSEPTRPYIKSVKKQTIGPDFHLPDWLPKNEWAEYVELRKRKRAPLTESIAKRVIAVLRELMDLGHPPAEVLAEAIDRNWTGIKTEWIHKSGGFERQKEGELSDRTQKILRRGL